MTSQDQEYWLEFLEIYKQSPCLWDTKSVLYSRRDVRSEAWNALLKKLKEKFAKANIDTVKTKIESFRTCYRRERKKVMKSVAAASSTDAIYEPSLWYYDFCSFLPSVDVEKDFRAIVQPNTVELVKVCLQNTDDVDNDENEDGDHNSSEEISFEDSSSLVYEKLNSTFVLNTPPMNKRRTIDKTSGIPTKIERIEKISPLIVSSSCDEFHYFAMGVASQLRQLPIEKALQTQIKIQSLLLQVRMDPLSYN